jgi:hypothetical protein
MPADFMAYLSEAFTKHEQERREKRVLNKKNKVMAKAQDSLDDTAIDNFVTFCRTKIKESPPVAVYSATVGIGFVLSDGTRIPFLDQVVANTPNYDYMPVTGLVSNGPMDKLPNSPSIHVFGG